MTWKVIACLRGGLGRVQDPVQRVEIAEHENPGRAQLVVKTMRDVEQRPQRLDIFGCQDHSITRISLATLRPMDVPVLPSSSCKAKQGWRVYPSRLEGSRSLAPPAKSSKQFL